MPESFNEMNDDNEEVGQLSEREPVGSLLKLPDN